MSALTNLDEIPERGTPLGPGSCRAEYPRPSGVEVGRVIRCNLPFGHDGDHTERDAQGEPLTTWTRQYTPSRTPRDVTKLAEMVDELHREVRTLVGEVAALREARTGPVRTPAGHAIQPLPAWLFSAASRTSDPGLALGFAGSAWVSAWMAATQASPPAAATDGGDDAH